MRVMTFGTFDNLHPGHRNYFSQAGKFGDELIIVVARDKNVLALKGRLPQEKEKIRERKVRQALKELGIKGKVVLGNIKDRWLVIKKYQPDIICLGYDQKTNLAQLKSAIAGWRFFCQIKRLKSYHPEKYKSSYCWGEKK